MTSRFPFLVLAAAFVLAASAAYYSVFGLSKLFASQATAVIILAGSLEASKLIAASYLHRYWKTISRWMRVYLVAAVVTLMCITSLGIYGFLVSAYQDTAYRFEQYELKHAQLTEAKERYLNQQKQITTTRSQLFSQRATLTGALANNVISYTDARGNQVVRTSSENRRAYETQLAGLDHEIGGLGAEYAALSDSVRALDQQLDKVQETADIAVEIGPLKYIAERVGHSVDEVVNWLIILLILVFDPLAIVLLLAATQAMKKPEPESKLSESPEQKAEEETKPVPEILSYWHTRNLRK